MRSQDQTVFLVDDDAGVRKSIRNALSKRGFTVEIFASAQAFLDGGLLDRPGCLVLDLSMPGMSGLELQQELATRNCTLPIIFITGHGDIPQSVQALKAGAIDFLEKPFRQEVLLERIQDAFKEDGRLRHTQEKQYSIRSLFESLTRRERDVLNLLVEGAANKSSKEIARELDISHRTVDQYRARIMQKTQARSIAELVQMTAKAGLFTSDAK